MSKLYVRNIANDIQTIHQMHLSDEAWIKIDEGVQGAILRDRESQQFQTDMWKSLYKDINKDKPYVVMNETIKRLKREIHEQPQHAETFSYVLFVINEMRNKYKDA